jgi:hypothetical protein
MLQAHHLQQHGAMLVLAMYLAFYLSEAREALTPVLACYLPLDSTGTQRYVCVHTVEQLHTCM